MRSPRFHRLDCAWSAANADTRVARGRAPARVLAGLLALVAACSEPVTTGAAGITVTVPCPSSSSSTITTVPVQPSGPPTWAYITPVIGGDPLVRGEDATLSITYAPPNAAVEFFEGEQGQGDGPCEDGVTGCAAILDPIPVGTAAADAVGSAALVLPIPADEDPRQILFQAKVTDPLTTAATWSTVMLRNVYLNSTEAHVGFVEVSHPAGIDVYTVGNTHTGGVAWIDYNGDLWPDLFVANGTNLNHRLYRNDGDGHFTDVSALIPKTAIAAEDAMGSFADIDNDGDADLLVVVDSPVLMDSETVQPYEGGPNLLYVNDGNGGFTEEALDRGLVDPRGWRNISASWADVDSDGDVDVFLGNWAMNSIVDGLLDNWSRLMINDGTGHFTESPQQLGEGKDLLTSMFFDANLDGWPDLYLGNVNQLTGYLWSNPEADDDFYLNDHGTFVSSIGLSPGVGDDAWAAMGLTPGDFDGDGDFDLFESDRFDQTDNYPRGSPLYVNNGDGTFADNSCDRAGICGGYSNWPSTWQDFDNDGLLDLFNGVSREEFQSLLFTNDGDGTFSANEIPAFGGAAIRGGAAADFDGDGRVDLATWVYGEEVQLFENKPRDAHHWVELSLVGATANRSAIGATARLTAGGKQQIRQITGGDSAHSQESAIVHFGIGDETSATLEILWPGGTWQDVGPVAVDTLSIVNQDVGVVPEQTTYSAASCSLAVGQVHADVRTNYGGRTGLHIAVGALAWDPVNLWFSGTSGPLGCPSQVHVSSDRGGGWDIPVDITP